MESYHLLVMAALIARILFGFRRNKYGVGNATLWLEELVIISFAATMDGPSPSPFDHTHCSSYPLRYRF